MKFLQTPIHSPALLFFLTFDQLLSMVIYVFALEAVVNLQSESLRYHLNLQLYYSLWFFLFEWSSLFETSFNKSLPFQSFQFIG